ncbi:vacuolar protein sorting-associated protein 54 [Aspergillus stella-maris]|uniref:vacuolar protein sorting-associated protein 54 n=1 Tax=Aspergillus stella-maris TaxID=1810926 RepID=UPI003CCCFC79
MSASPRKSIDSLASGASTPSLSQYSFNQVESPRVSTQRYPLRRGSTASSIVSIGGVLDPSSRHGAIAESGQNAISTLLQPPIVRTGLVPHSSAASGGYKPPSTRDIPPVTLTNIPHVDRKVFEPYLTQVGSLYEVFQEAKEGNEQESQLARGGQLSPREENGPLTPGRMERRLSAISTTSRSSSPYAGGRKRSTNRGRTPAITPLSTIPPVYFEDDFHLENPRTFDVVSERSEVVTPPKAPSKDNNKVEVVEPAPIGRKALATNAILQEKLSWYMDTVEIHLISSISTASKSFFTALGSLRELHAEAADSVKRIQVLRKDLQKIDKEMALGGLKIVNLRRRRENVRMLSDAVSQLRDVVQSVTQCEELAEVGNIEEAADGLEKVENLMAGNYTPEQSEGEARRTVDLRRLKALEGASNELVRLRYQIGTGYENRFLNELLGDLRRHVESAPVAATVQRWGYSFSRQRGGQRSSMTEPPSYMSIDDKLRTELRSHLTGLARVHHTTPAATTFKTAVLREMKSLIRRHMPSSNDDDNESMVSVSTHKSHQLSAQEKSSILARNLRAMDAEDAYSMLTQIYSGVSESLRRLSVQVKVLLDIASGLGGLQSPKSPSTPAPVSHAAQDEILQVLDMSSLLGQAVDIAQSQATKVLKVRSEQTANLTKEDFVKYFTLNRLFADECEAISGRGGAAFKTVVGNQIKDFINRFGNEQRHKTVQVMDADRWDAKDFGAPEEAILGRILGASTRDIDVWVDASKIWVQNGQSAPESAVNGSGTENGTVRNAVIDEQKYILSDSAMAMMRSIEEYQFLMANIPNMIPDISAGLLESLKLFNSRSSQLILGAGATKSAGLKNITTKHLALSSQALSFIIALVPYIREFVRRHSPPSSLMADFDKVKRLYQEHQSGIHEKLVEIMGGRSSVHANAMRKIDWDSGPSSSGPSPYMETLTKETGTLHRVLSRHLPEMTVMMIMDPVFQSYRDQWTRAFDEAQVKTESGKQKLQRDAEYFQTKLSKIDGFGDLGERLLELVNLKRIETGGSKEPAENGNNQGKSSPKPEGENKQS